MHEVDRRAQELRVPDPNREGALRPIREIGRDHHTLHRLGAHGSNLEPPRPVARQPQGGSDPDGSRASTRRAPPQRVGWYVIFTGWRSGLNSGGRSKTMTPSAVFPARNDLGVSSGPQP